MMRSYDKRGDLSTERSSLGLADRARYKGPLEVAIQPRWPPRTVSGTFATRQPVKQRRDMGDVTGGGGSDASSVTHLVYLRESVYVCLRKSCVLCFPRTTKKIKQQYLLLRLFSCQSHRKVISCYFYAPYYRAACRIVLAESRL